MISFVLFVACLTVGVHCQQQQCGQGEVFAQCHNQFPPTCVEQKPAGFPVPCKPGCNCANGYIRKDASAGAKCVPVNQCSGGVKCGPNEVFKSCPTPPQCARSCQNFQHTTPAAPACNTPCAAYGCECKQGFVRQQNGNVCIREQDCAFVTTPAGAMGSTQAGDGDRRTPVAGGRTSAERGSTPGLGGGLTSGDGDRTSGDGDRASTPAGARSTRQPLNCGPNEVLKKKNDCPKTPECEAQCVQGVSKPSKCNSCHSQQRCECQAGYVRQMDHGQKICISTDDCGFNKGPKNP